MNKIKRY